MALEYGALAFPEQIAFFRQKLNLPTNRWDDIWQSAHDRAFVVASAAKADLLADLRAAVEKGIAEGTTLDEFRRDFAAIVQKHGWTGWAGEGSASGRAWRARVIYETNLRTSYAAGRYAYLRENIDSTPFWRYNHNDSVMHPRPHHVALDGLILPADDPFWGRAYPPNGWGCKCFVDGVNMAYIKAQHLRVGAAPDGFEPDPGWAYAPGASVADELANIIRGKAADLPQPLRQDFIGSLAENLTDSPVLRNLWRLLGG